MSTVHLHMMELEGDGQRSFHPPLTVFPPHHHGVAKLVGILVDDAVQLCLYHCRGADDHTIVQERAFASEGDLLC